MNFLSRIKRLILKIRIWPKEIIMSQSPENNLNLKRRHCECSCDCHDPDSPEIKKRRNSDANEGSTTKKRNHVSKTEFADVASKLKSRVVKWREFFDGVKKYRDPLLTLIKTDKLEPKTVTEGFARKLFLAYPGFANQLALLVNRNYGKPIEALLNFFQKKGLFSLCERYSQQAQEVLVTLDKIEGKKCYLEDNESAESPVDFAKLKGQGSVNARELGLGSLYLQPAKCFKEIVSLMDDLIRISDKESEKGLTTSLKAIKKVSEFDMMTKFQDRLE